MTELVDVADLKSAAYNRAYGFDPRFRDHQPLSICRSSLRSRGFDDGQKKEIQYGLPCGLLFLYLQKTHSPLAILAAPDCRFTPNSIPHPHMKKRSPAAFAAGDLSLSAL